MTFIKYENKYTKSSSNKIGISSTGLISLSVMFCEPNGIDANSTVTFYWDSENPSLFAMRFSRIPEQDCFKITMNRKGNYGMLSAKSFFRRNGIDLQSAKGKHVAEKKEIDGIGEVFVVNLKK